MRNSSTTFFNNTEQRETAPSDLPPRYSVVRKKEIPFSDFKPFGIRCMIFDSRMLLT